MPGRFKSGRWAYPRTQDGLSSVAVARLAVAPERYVRPQHPLKGGPRNGGFGARAGIAHGGGSPHAERAVIGLISLAGATAATSSLVLALRNDTISADIGEPLVIALLSVWVTTSYILCGLIAWWHRPASRFGPLMIAAGFANFLSSLAWSTSDVVFTFGQALDLLPPVLFLHVFLAFPSGRLRGRFEHWLVVSAYITAIRLELVRMTFGYFGPLNLLEINENADAAWPPPRAAHADQRLRDGVGILVARRLRDGRQLRWSLALLADAFGLALVMIAALLMSAAWGGLRCSRSGGRPSPRSAWRRSPFSSLSSTRAWPARPWAISLSSQADPAGRPSRGSRARALSDPPSHLPTGSRTTAATRIGRRRSIELPEADSGTATTRIDQGEFMAVLLHDPALEDESELLSAVTAAAGLGLENGRLHAELRAHVVELSASRARIIDVGQKERQRLERNLHDGAQQRLIALSLELSLLEQELGDGDGAGKRLARAREEIATSLGRCARWPAGFTPLWSAAMVSQSPSSNSPHVHRSLFV